MPSNFIARSDPDDSLIAAVAKASPQSPFNTPAYVAAKKSMHAQPCAFGFRNDTEIVAGTIGYIQGGPFVKYLDIPTWPVPEYSELFAKGIFAFCLKEGISRLNISNFATPAFRMPTFERQIQSGQRTEFVVDLQQDDLPSQFSKNHRRNRRKALRSGVTVVSSADVGLAADHLQVMQASANRRRTRGETVELPESPLEIQMMMASGAARLFQAKQADKVIASALVLLSDSAGYYHSAGASKEGMALGASTLIIAEMMQNLKEQGHKTLNLGGAGPNSEGLTRFKKDFGAQEISLASVDCYTVSEARILLRRICQKSHSVYRRFLPAI